MKGQENTIIEDQFTSEEWKLLRDLIYIIFFTVAMIDGEIDKQEVGVFLTNIGMSRLPLGPPEDPLHRKLLRDIGETEDGGLKEYQELLNDLQRNPWIGPRIFLRVKPILKENLSSAEYQRFIGSLMIFCALWVAKATGAVSTKQAEVIASFSHQLDFDPDCLLRDFPDYEEAEELIKYCEA